MFFRDRSWVAIAPIALAKSRSERSPSCLAAPMIAHPLLSMMVWTLLLGAGACLCSAASGKRSSGTALGSLSLP